MAGTITITSTTDSKEDVEAALAMRGGEPTMDTPNAAAVVETPTQPGASSASTTPSQAASDPADEVVASPETAPPAKETGATDAEERAAKKMTARLEAIKADIDRATRAKYESRAEAEVEQRRMAQMRQERQQI